MDYPIDLRAEFGRLTRLVETQGLRTLFPDPGDRRPQSPFIDAGDRAGGSAGLDVGTADGQRDRCEQRPTISAGARGTPADGPDPPKSFRYRGNTVDLEPKPWALLAHVWAAPDRKAKVNDAETDVWGESAETEGRLKSAMTRANKALLEVNCPLQLGKSGDWLTLS